MEIIETEIPIYRQALTLVKASNLERVKAFFENLGCDLEIDTLYAHTIDHKRYDDNGLEYSCIYLVLNDKNKYRRLTFGVIAHEALHVVHYTFERIGAFLDADNPEPGNYLLEYVTDLILEKISLDV